MKFAGLFFKKETFHCIICGGRFPKVYADVSDSGLCICRDCSAKIDRYVSASVFEGEGKLKFLIASYPYSGPLKDAFIQYKFCGQRAYYSIFSKLMCMTAESFIKDGDFDLVIPVPLSKRRMNERGFNQSGLIAEVLAETFDIPYSESVLFRIKNTKRQSGLNNVQRNENIKNAFFADKRLISGKRILLVDDIYTRGATLGECARVLTENGAEFAAGITLFKSHIPVDAADIYDFEIHSGKD
jgi:competence protein ComFC